jgi:hypothetical protein
MRPGHVPFYPKTTNSVISCSQEIRVPWKAESIVRGVGRQGVALLQVEGLLKNHAHIIKWEKLAEWVKSNSSY